MSGKDLLFKLFFSIEEQFVNKELVYGAMLLGCLELFTGGVTCFADMYCFEDQVANASKNIGMRAVLGETIANFVTPDTKEPYGEIVYACDFVSKLKNDSLITPAYAPHASYTVSVDVLKEVNHCAEKDGVPVLMHLAEMRNEDDLIWDNLHQNQKRISLILYLAEQNVLSSNLLAAHCTCS